MKITRYIEQTLRKNPWVFGTPPALKCTPGGGAQGGVPLSAGFEGAQPLTFIVVLVWLLHGHKMHKFVTLDGGQCPRTATPQLCTLCEHGHAVIANLVKLGGSSRMRGGAPEWAWFHVTKGGLPGGADHGGLE